MWGCPHGQFVTHCVSNQHCPAPLDSEPCTNGGAKLRVAADNAFCESEVESVILIALDSEQEK